MSEFKNTGSGWLVRGNTRQIAEARRLKKENKELKDVLQTLAERLEKLEEKVSE